MEQANYVILTGDDMEAFVEEVNRLQKLGAANAGTFGTSCSKCWKEVASSDSVARGQCRCGTKSVVEETMQALGFDGLPFFPSKWTPV